MYNCTVFCLILRFDNVETRKRIRLSIFPDEEFETDWSNCFQCQADTSEVSILPEKIPKQIMGIHDDLWQKNIPEFHKINEMPIALDMRRIDNGDACSE